MSASAPSVRLVAVSVFCISTGALIVVVLNPVREFIAEHSPRVRLFFAPPFIVSVFPVNARPSISTFPVEVSVIVSAFAFPFLACAMMLMFLRANAYFGAMDVTPRFR